MLAILCVGLLAVLPYGGCSDDDDDGGGADTDTDTDIDGDVDSDSDTDFCLPGKIPAACGLYADDGCHEGNFVVASAEDVDAIAGVPCVTGALEVTTSELTEISLPDLTAVCGMLVIDNSSLASLTLENLDDIRRWLCVARNTSPTDIQLPALSNLGGSVIVTGNEELVDVPNIGGVKGTTGFEVVGNTMLSSLSGFQQLEEVDAFNIELNASLVTLVGLEGLTTVSSHMIIKENPVLDSLSGLENLTYVDWFVDVLENPALASVDGLSALGSADKLRMFLNDSLTNLDGLSSLTSLNYFEIWGHAQLPDCEACELLEQLTNDPMSIDVHDNLDDDCTPVPDNCP
jgi:hypothetical protein